MLTGQAGPRIVALGGGHGLYAALRAACHLTTNLTAVVTVADDGGSSGRLRAEFGALPPGDLRMALAALCGDLHRQQLWAQVLQHRFHSTGPLDNHALGNLLIMGLWQQLGDPIDGLDYIGRLVGAKGRVLPMASEPLEIEATALVDGQEVVVRGQSRVAVTPAVQSVCLLPADPHVDERVIAAVREADWIILGPGSWFTSVLPHLLVPALRRALVATRARRILTLNLVPQRGETEGMSAADHVEVLLRHAPDFRLDVIVADPSQVDDIAALDRAASASGARVTLRQVHRADDHAVHDELRLAAAFRDACDGLVGDID
ncbi:uridine diphosphate-N-acetylglucosamine-binding protein YvcK [Buchananella hordeovulneris]|uniref:gluconeogenesis factor YvcK family protein n=1 Tax=Buchananella hordeovulneris TaxID=52770 RepID=UPI000F5EDC26|nr:uridine diphosphate-N-acetylglucosamine-binding protein YvcK [Buchananella hordeovulneris]RRD53784.1 uridine diphosphate-N-acetylglucosamine-binding protein YvcK [Buchananella hordeovulneris]